jgi:diguanylate cyclase
VATLTVSAEPNAVDAPDQLFRRRLVETDFLLAVLIAAYTASLILRRTLNFNAAVDGWSVDAFEFVVAVWCLSRAFTRRPGRLVPLLFGMGLLSWCIGDIFITIESLGGATPPAVSIKDVFYIGFYPCAYAAIVVFMRRQMRGLSFASWIDGLVAGLGAAALCAAFAFHGVERLSRLGSTDAATSLIYPIGDLVLFGLVIGATALMRDRYRLPWILIAVACSVNAAGDTFNLFQSSSFGSTRIAVIANSIAWPIAFVLIANSVWVKQPPADPKLSDKPTGFVLPGIAAITGLAILFVGTADHVGKQAIGLATATLLVAGVRLTFSVRQMRALTAQRQMQSITDELTGLGNRRRLTQVLDNYFADSDSPYGSRQLAFLFIDLDHFKEVNDSFGHAAGDELLGQIGPRFSRSLRTSDLLVRLGGDEFAAVLFGADGDYSRVIARRIATSLKEPFVLNSVESHISASIGIALAPAHASDGIGLLRCADSAMYRAKLRNESFEMYDAALDHDGNLLQLVEELREAVENKDFVLHFQPQLDLRDHKVKAVEALLRWRHPRLGDLPPVQFLPLVEDAGLMPALTRLVLDGALGQCAVWRAAGENIVVSVNISASNLLEDGFGDVVREALARHNLPPESLVLEITETCVISDYERSKRVIEDLRGIGVVMSIDDFGAGFTSLAYLSNLAVGELKLDRSLILKLGRGDRDENLIRSTIELGHALGMRVVAEGIEETAVLEELTGLGCDYAQGFLISRPKPADELDLSDRDPLVDVAKVPGGTFDPYPAATSTTFD